MKKISIFVITILLSGSLLIIPPSDSGNLIENDTSINKNTTNVENQVLIEEPVNDFNKNGFGNYFTANHGQVGSDDVKYYIHGKGVWFTSTGVVFVLREPVDNQPRGFDESKIPDFDSCKKPETVQYKSEVVTFEFVNCNNVNHVGVGELPHKSNFFYGNNSSKWCTYVPNFREIYFESIYDKIDLRYYFNDNGLKYDFIVNPGGDPNDIAIKVEGAEELILGIGNSGAMTQPPEFNTPLTTQHTPLNNHSDSSKDTLTIKTGLNDIVDSDLFVYQEHNDIITEVTAGFRLINSDCYGFSILDDYDKLKPLVIDPLIFSTYFGGKEADNCKDMQIDKHGNLYMTGWTTSGSS